MQDITIRRLEDVIAEFEEGTEAKVEQEAEARAKVAQEVRRRRRGDAVCFFVEGRLRRIR